jgi:hypothetical protein
VKKTSKRAGRNIVGQRVRQARLSSKPPVSQGDLAGKLAAVGVLLDRSAISRIEGQDRYVMDYEVAALAKALKVSVAWLFWGGALNSLKALQTLSHCERDQLPTSSTAKLRP